MLRIAIIFITGLALAVGYDPAPVADACGVKLTVKSPRVKKRVRRTSHPSHVLVLGRPPSKKLARWLKQAGHTVEITKNAKDTKRKDYAIIISDAEKVNEARSQFPRTRVVTRSGSLSSNVRKIERVLAKKTSANRPTRVAARAPERKARRKARPKTEKIEKTEPAVETAPAREDVAEPILPGSGSSDGDSDSGSSDSDSGSNDSDSGSNDSTDTEPESKPDPVEKVRPESKRKNVRVRWAGELYFGSNRDGLSKSMKKKLRANARWLAANSDVNITIEGHTDASGPDEYNKLLGERRAEAVRAYLVQQGVDESRLEVISYGEERPKYRSARKNRRVVLVKN